MLVRAVVPQDIPQIMTLAQESDTAAHWSAREYDVLFTPEAPERIALVAERAPNGIAGFLVARCALDEWEIENVVADPRFRRQGIAQSMIDELLRQARQSGICAILLEVRESNAAARALYGKMGFSEEGRRPSYYAQPEEDALLLRLPL